MCIEYCRREVTSQTTHSIILFGNSKEEICVQHFKFDMINLFSMRSLCRFAACLHNHHQEINVSSGVTV